jgi:membrane-bound serine protease (ClpP class)
MNAIQDPNRAWIVLLIGLVLVYRECSAPGRVLPGVFGAVAVCAAIYSLFQHPWDSRALLAIIAAIGLMLVQVFGRYFWLPGIVSAVLLTFGVHRLTYPPIRLLLASLSIPLSGITIFLLRTALLARRNKVSLQ